MTDETKDPPSDDPQDRVRVDCSFEEQCYCCSSTILSTLICFFYCILLCKRNDEIHP